MESVKSDEPDARGLFDALRISDAPPTTVISGSAKDKVYSLNYPKRGRCLIFNHKEFKKHTGLNTRNGTDADAARLYCKFRELQFDVSLFTDLKVEEVKKEIKKASKEEHGENSAFVCCILSHGEQGVLYAADGKYTTDTVFTPFRGDNCPSLAGKPKIFFIQACQGDQLDCGVTVECRETTDSNDSKELKIPVCADFLIVYSTVPGFYSWRNTTHGSWFIQALCEAIQENIKDLDLLSILTIVNYKVAFSYESYTPHEPSMHLKKQIPSVNSTLTRMIKFF
ncbi:caspase drICE isoform X2 [Parasteatoda tepidariorum]|nr:caspase isoform X2 [Parasteatoda tepidariorum]XP_042896645.1 caspase isoform X2 [Parasteatoda tepidariorum]